MCLKVGDRVRHSKCGDGTVIQILKDKYVISYDSGEFAHCAESELSKLVVMK